LYNVINKRSQDQVIAEALRHVQLDYLAYQIESYYKRFVFSTAQTLFKFSIPFDHDMNLQKK